MLSGTWDLSNGWQESKYLSYHLVPSQVHEKKAKELALHVRHLLCGRKIPVTMEPTPS